MEAGPKHGEKKEKEPKDWEQHKHELVQLIADEYEQAAPGEYYPVVIKVDPAHNPISGYWVLRKP